MPTAPRPRPVPTLDTPPARPALAGRGIGRQRTLLETIRRPLKRATPGGALIAVFLVATSAHAGPYAPRSGTPGTTAIPADSPRFVGFATGVASATRGPQNITDPASPIATFGAPADALGAPAGSPDAVNGGAAGVVSLGDGGRIALTFAAPITDGPGPDFAVFENGLPLAGSATRDFLELAFVEVSTDGLTFARFPAVSLTPTGTQIGTFGTLDASDVNGLAGKDLTGFGTPFDLSDLPATAGVDPLRITQVRLVDVVGSIDPLYATLDSLGNAVNDPFTTPFPTGGFDLDAVGVLNAVPEPGLLGLIGLAFVALTRGRRSRLHR